MSGLPVTPDVPAAPPTEPRAMGDERPAEPAVPAGPTERFESLDVVRGFALLGIFAMNIASFALLGTAYFDPNYAGTHSNLDWAVWGVNYVVFEQKMMSLFSILFGAGVMLFAQRAARKGVSPIGLHYRRMGWLALFGFLHAYLLWYGDILLPYAVCGMLVFLFRRWPARRLFLLAGGFFLLACVTFFLSGLLMRFEPAMTQPASPELIAESMRVEGGDIEGGYLSRIRGFNSRSAFLMHLWGIPSMYLPMNSALMLLGMGLYKTGFLTASRSRGVYVRTLLVATPVALALVGLGAWLRWRSEFVFADYMSYAAALGALAAAAAAIAYASALNLVVLSDAVRPLRTALSAVGRLAFTNYIMQTVIASLIFYTPGLGLWMELSRAELVPIVVGVWAFQIVFSLVYLRFFTMGPLEWLWRCGTYQRFVALPRARGAAAS